MFEHKYNHALCENMNKVRLRILTSGYAKADKESDWQGVVTNPAFSRLYYILSGEFYIIGKDGTKLVLSAGNCYLLPAGYSFRFGCDSTFEQIYFHIKLCDFKEIDLLRHCPAPLDYDLPKEMIGQYVSLLDTPGILGSMNAKQHVYASLCTLLEKHQIELERSEYSPPVRKAIEYIEANLSLQLQLKEIAASSFTAPSTLTRNFKKETGMTIGQYIDESIMFQAGQLLRFSKTSVLEISEKFGFCDQFYFARRFKEKFDMSPRDYRRSTLI